MATNKNITTTDTLDIVFENRNKAYGAYQLRRDYPVYLARALGSCLLLIGVALSLPLILSAVSRVMTVPDTLTVNVEMGPPPEIEKPLVPPPSLPAPPPPSRPTMTFVPPVVVPNEQATDEQLYTPDELLESKVEIGSKENEGDPDAPPSDAFTPSELGTLLEYKPAPQDETVHESYSVQKMPVFGSGENDLLEYLAKTIKYPPLARENNIQGVVVLSFVVDKEGNIKNVTTLKDIGGGCSKEAIRVVQMMPRWSPGEANGHPVNVRFMLPVRFKLD